MASRKKRFDDGANPSRDFNVQTAATSLHPAVTRRTFRLILTCLILDSIVTAQAGAHTGRIDGTVFVVDSGPSCLPGAKVKLSGAASVDQQTDQEGRFSFDKVAPGTYTIAAEFPGLQAEQNITVEAGKVANVALALKLSEVKTEVTVTAATAEVKGEPATQTLSSTTVRDTPNQNERTDSILALIPGVVRGPDGRINIQGARSTQSSALVNSANVTDPATGNPALDVPIDVVASVQVISNPYDPEYGQFTGADSTVDTKTSNYEKFRFSIQNVMPRVCVRDGSIFGVGGATPRTTVTGPLIKDRVAFTQSIECRFVRTPVNSLPAFQRDTTLEGVNSYTRFDLNLSSKQTATVSFSLYPHKLKDLGLNTFTPQASAPDYHQRGYQVYAQDRYLVGQQGLLTSQFSYKVFDSDITPHTDDPYRLLVETTEGGFFNEQARRSSRLDLGETYQLAPSHFWGEPRWKIGLDYAYSQHSARELFRPVEIDGAAGSAIESITFSGATSSSVDQYEAAAFVSDHWTPVSRFTTDSGARLDHDTVTDQTHASPRGGFRLALTGDDKTVLKGGAGISYDRVALMIAAFRSLPGRTVSLLDQQGNITSATSYVNQVAGNLQNPRSYAWNLALSRKVLQQLALQVAYENRETTRDFVVSPVANASSGVLYLANEGKRSYRELQVSARDRLHHHVLNASYVHSKAYGDLNDFFQFFGNVAKPVMQTDVQGRLSYDAPNRFLAWGEIRAPWKLTVLPVFETHTGFPYSVQDAYRDHVGPRNTKRFPWFSSTDLQVLRPLSIPFRDRHIHARADFTVFNVFNHYNPRDVQSVAD